MFKRRHTLNRGGLSSFAIGLALAIPAPAHAQRAAETVESASAINMDARKKYREGKFEEAEKLYLQALQARQKLLGENHPDTAVSFAELATLYKDQKRFSEADSFFLMAIARLEATLGADHLDTIITVNDLAVSYEEQGRFSEAEPLYLRAIAAYERMGSADQGELLVTLDNLGRLYDSQNRTVEAEQIFRRVYDGRLKLHGEGKEKTVAAAHRLGRLLQKLGSAEADTLLAQQVAKPLSKFEQGIKEVERFVKIGEDAERAGNLKIREDALLIGLEIAMSDLGMHDEYTIMLFGMLADNLVKLDNPAAASQLMRKAANLSREHLGAEHRMTLTAEHNVAYQLAATRRWDEAATAMRKVIADRERIGGKDDQGVASSRLVLANILAEQEKLGEAIQEYQAGLSVLQAQLGQTHVSILPALSGYGRYLSRQGRHMEALRSVLDAYKAAKDSPDVSERVAVDTRRSFAEVLLRASRDQDLAFAVADEAARMEEAALIGDLGGAEMQKDFERRLGGTKFLFRLVADAAWDVRKSASAIPADFAALDALQKAALSPAAVAIMAERERQGAELGGEAQRQALGRRDALVARSAELDEALYAELGAPETDPIRFKSIINDRKNVRQEIDALTQGTGKLLEERSRVADLKATYRLLLPSIATEIRKTLRPDEALLFVVPSEFGTHVIAFNSDKDLWFRADLTREQASDAVNKLRKDLASPTGPSRGLERTDTLPAFNRQLAHELYMKLVAPVGAVLESKKNLFVAVDGDLASLPLAVLVTDTPRGDDGDPVALRDTPWLGERTAITQIASIQDFVVARQIESARKGIPANSFLGFGDPALGNRETTRDGLGLSTPSASLLSPSRAASGVILSDPSKLRQLARLPGTARELRAMAEAFNAPASAVRLGEQATERDVRSADLSKANVIAFATHGLVAGEVGGIDQPALVFTPPSTASLEDDGLLTALEIARLKLSADWIILSACNTAAGSGEQEPGLSGLARAFFQAGARSLLVTHWPVRDDIAADLTVATVRAQKEQGLTAGEALQYAMRQVRTSTSDPSRAHPAAWAPFALVGNGGS